MCCPSQNVSLANAQDEFHNPIEFWPDYRPLDDWVVTHDDPRCQIEIGATPFDFKRLLDYAGFDFKIIPTLNSADFDTKDLTWTMVFNNPQPYDTVRFDPPYRYYAFRGHRRVVYDALHDYKAVGYTLVPFVRNVDAVFRHPKNGLDIYISNDWYYAFDRYNRFIRQGYLSYLWPRSTYNLFLDAVLVTSDGTICQFYNSKIQCGSRPPVELRRVYENASSIALPIRAAFFVPNVTSMFQPFPSALPEQDRIVLLDSLNTFWVYDAVSNRLIDQSPFCDFMEFGKMYGCPVPQIEEEGSGSGEQDFSETLHGDERNIFRNASFQPNRSDTLTIIDADV